MNDVMVRQVINYSELIDGAMRAVVREVLRQVSRTGLPGDHHFYVTFRTDFPGVEISDTLSSRYPQEMTIVIQHQFWDFRVEDQQFHVTLSFGGTPERLTIPFSALTAFADPSVKFSLQFHYEYEDEDYEDTLPIEPLYEDMSLEDKANTDNEKAAGAEILSFDQFRKK